MKNWSNIFPGARNPSGNTPYKLSALNVSEDRAKDTNMKNALNNVASGVYKGVNKVGSAIGNAWGSVNGGLRGGAPSMTSTPRPTTNTASRMSNNPITKLRDNVAASSTNPASGFMQHYKDIDSYKKGGKVKKTGLAYLHKGEKVIPKGREEALEKKMKDCK